MMVVLVLVTSLWHNASMSPSLSQFKIYVRQPVVMACLLFLIVGLPILVGAVYQGQFVRYIADDFCTASIAHTQGWWQAQVYWYQQWSGRFGFTAIVSALELTGLTIVPLLPFITIIIWGIGLTWLIYKCMRLLGYYNATLMPALSLTVLTLAVYVLTNPQPGQAFFWFTGNLTYTLPLVCLTFLALAGSYILDIAIKTNFNLQFYQRRRVQALLVSIAVGSFLTVGLNETHGLAQLTLITGLVIAVVILGLSRTNVWRSLLPALGLALAASAIGFYLMYQAPGNATRTAHFPPNPTIEETLAQSTQAVSHYLIVDWPYAWFVYLVLITMVLVVLLPRPKLAVTISSDSIMNAIYRSLLVGMVSYLLILIHYAPSYYVQHYPTEARTYAASAFILAISAVCIGFIWGRLVAVYQPTDSFYRRLRLFVLALVSLGLAGRLVQTQLLPVWQTNLDQRSSWQAYAQSWDDRHRQLLSQSGSTKPLQLKRLGHTMGLEDISMNADHWINVCVSSFYHLSEVVGY